MKQITKWVTHDGLEFDQHADALDHLLGRRGNIICMLAHKIAALDFKYTTTVQYLDEVINELAQEIVNINNDLRHQQEYNY